MSLFMPQPIADASKLSVVITRRTACVYWHFIITKPILFETKTGNGRQCAVCICTCNKLYSTSLPKFAYLVSRSFIFSFASLLSFFFHRGPKPEPLKLSVSYCSQCIKRFVIVSVLIKVKIAKNFVYSKNANHPFIAYFAVGHWALLEI